MNVRTGKLFGNPTLLELHGFNEPVALPPFVAVPTCRMRLGDSNPLQSRKRRHDNGDSQT